MPVQQTKPIELHFWPTPNGKKSTIMLEELGVERGNIMMDDFGL